MSNSRSASAVTVNGPSWKFITSVLGCDSQAGIDAWEEGITTKSVSGLDAVDISSLFVRSGFRKLSLPEKRRFRAFVSIGRRDSQKIEGEREAYRVVIIG